MLIIVLIHMNPCCSGAIYEVVSYRITSQILI
nr:MAG TPA: hypothetical protein [Bacteriophage sp.]